MGEVVLAIDAGTTSVRAIVVDSEGGVLGRGRERCVLSYPKPGLVEQDPESLWETTRRVVDRALTSAGIRSGEVAAIGITSQRSCCAVWERATGRPVSPVVSWQDLRGISRALEFQAMGLPIQPQAAAAKLEAVVDTIPDGRARVARGELAWGGVDSYLIARMTNGGAHVTDPSQACATAYFDYETGTWSSPLLDMQRFPVEFFPKLVDTAGVSAETSSTVFGAAMPIAAIAGDQQSAAIAQHCDSPGDGKVTYGTSATCNVNTGGDVVQAAGAYPLVLKRIEGQTTFCLEGMVITAGAMFDWLANGLGLMKDAGESGAMAGAVHDSGGVLVLPALQGLGTPHFDFTRTAEIRGLTRGASAAQIVLAAMEGLAFRVREMIEAMDADTGLLKHPWLRVDGGATVDDVFMQVQADILGRTIQPMRPVEATVCGAAVLAARSVKGWSSDSWFAGGRREFVPAISADERDAKFAAWKKAFGLTGAT